MLSLMNAASALKADDREWLKNETLRQLEGCRVDVVDDILVAVHRIVRLIGFGLQVKVVVCIVTAKPVVLAKSTFERIGNRDPGQDTIYQKCQSCNPHS